MTDDRRLTRREKPVSGQVEDYNPAAEEELDEGPSADDIARFSEVTIKCTKCGTELLDDVALCWQCGHALGTPEETRALPLWAVAATVLVLISFLLFFIL